MKTEMLREIIVPHNRDFGTSTFFCRKATEWYRERIADHDNNELRLGQKILAYAYGNPEKAFTGHPIGRWNSDREILNLEGFKSIVTDMGVDYQKACSAARLAGDFQAYTDAYYRYTGQKPMNTAAGIHFA